MARPACWMLMTLAAALLLALGSARAQELSPAYYDGSCPNLYDTVRRVIQEARTADPRILASLTRLHFHDCFVNVRSPSTIAVCCARQAYMHACFHNPELY
jgi:peroxidase